MESKWSCPLFCHNQGNYCRCHLFCLCLYWFWVLMSLIHQCIVVLQYGDRDASYDDYLQHLSNVGPEQCRYGLYDFEYEHACQGTSDVSMCCLAAIILTLFVGLRCICVNFNSLFCSSCSGTWYQWTCVLIGFAILLQFHVLFNI